MKLIEKLYIVTTQCGADCDEETICSIGDQYSMQAASSNREMAERLIKSMEALSPSKKFELVTFVREKNETRH